LITKSLFKVTVGAEKNEAEAKDMIQDHLRARAGESAGAVLVLEEDEDRGGGYRPERSRSLGPCHARLWRRAMAEIDCHERANAHCHLDAPSIGSNAQILAQMRSTRHRRSVIAYCRARESLLTSRSGEIQVIRGPRNRVAHRQC
jgi:hypothetical protein